MNLLHLFAIAALFEGFVVGQSDFFDVSCHPEYKANPTAEARIKTRRQSDCEHMKTVEGHCMKECLIQLTALVEFLDDLNTDDHAMFMAQFVPMAKAKELATKIASNCNDLYKQALYGGNVGGDEIVRCDGPDDAKWNALYDCVESVWKCKA